MLQVDHHLVVDESFALALGKTSHMHTADAREVDAAVVVDKIGLQVAGTRREVTRGVQRVRHREVEMAHGLGVGNATDGNRQQVLRHDAGIKETLRCSQAQRVDILEIGYFLTACAAAHKHDRT